MKYLVLLLIVAAYPTSVQAEGPFPQTCSYQDKSEPDEDGANEVSCTMRYSSIPTGVRYTFRFGGRTVVVEHSSAKVNGLWGAATINGRPAVRLELWRGSYVAVTTDMRVSLEWRDRNAPKYPVN